MNTCTFTFTTARTLLSCEVYGVERTWEYLQREFNRRSEGLKDARYYERFGPGPLLFAVIGDAVYYNDQNQWCPYESASKVSHGIIEIEDW